jgi:enoyl-CoA hydratase/carnithine racemase
MISMEQRERVAVLRLDRSVTNALDLDCVQKLAKALKGVREDPAIRGLVLTSSSAKFFAIGFDIPHLFDLSRADFEDFYRAFNLACMDLYTMPKPTVAAITGHAIAGGCILAICCDYRFIAEGRKLMGLNEVKLGVPVPYLADRVLTQLVGVRYAREIMEGGEFYGPDKLSAMGMVDRVLPIDQVVEQAVEWAAELGDMPGSAFERIKENRVERVAAEVAGCAEQKKQKFIECWYSEPAREQLREAMDKF